MPYHIFINRESGDDNISIFYDDPVFVVIANKNDLPAISIKSVLNFRTVLLIFISISSFHDLLI